MKKKSYDVIIVGAGLGGLRLAYLLNSSNLKVLLIEKNKSIKKLTKKYFGTFVEYLERWNLKPYLLYKSGWGIYATEVRSFNQKHNEMLAILDMEKWSKNLKLNCDVKKGVEIKKLKREKDSITLFDKNKNSYSSKLLVDASGIAQTISSLLGIEKSHCDFLNYVYIMENPKLKDRKEMFYFQDSNLTNCGGWFYTLEKNRCLVGCAEFTGPRTLKEKELKKRLNEYVKNFIPLNKILKDAKIVDEFCKAGPTTTLHSSFVEDNFIALGDAAGAGAPFIGDGFRMAFGMADSAYETIIKAFEKNNFSKKILKLHKRNFNKDFGKWYKWSMLVRFIYLRYLTNKELNKIAENFGKILNQDYYDFLFSKITPRILLKIFSPRLYFSILKNMIIYHILEPLKITQIPRRPH